jgi:hypothetical protein
MNEEQLKWFQSGRTSSLVSFWRLRQDRQQVKTAQIPFERPGRRFQVNYPYFPVARLVPQLAECLHCEETSIQRLRYSLLVL